MNKKAQGVSITVVIVATIALLVLVVLAAIFIGRAGTFKRGVEDCELQPNSRCFDAAEGCNEPYATPRPDVKCFKDDGEVDVDKICCIKLG